MGTTVVRRNEHVSNEESKKIRNCEMKIFLMIAVFLVWRGEAKALSRRKGGALRKILEADGTSLFTHAIAQFNELAEKDKDLTAKVQDLTEKLEAVNAAKKIRLLGLAGSKPMGSQKSGRLEVWHDGEWGTVCDDTFDDNDAVVVCRSLGFTGGAKYKSGASAYGFEYFDDKAAVNEGELGWVGSGPIWLNNVKCVGTEQDFFQCPGVATNPNWGSHGCRHFEDVFMKCN